MRQSKSPLRGSVTQNVSARVREQDGISFLARLGLLAVTLLLLLIIAIVGWRSGWAAREAERLKKSFFNITKSIAFEVRDIAVEGRNQASKEEIFSALNVKRGDPILSVDIGEAANNLGKLAWIDTARVERHLPDTISVVLSERVPLARWQVSDHFYVIDDQGEILKSAKVDDFASLPQIVGAGAEREAKGFLNLLKSYPDIVGKIASIVRVGERRWDIHTTSKIVVRLPETKSEDALRKLSVLIAEEKILDRDITAVDLRMSDRLVIEPAEAPKPAGDKKP
ncbi:MAG: cell division protein FtsQ/DivIB [Alphaproteobacteria bacterium]|nr:cell division protein FtsQ/DivIB [Alphaproteobacteria bacterium]